MLQKRSIGTLRQLHTQTLLDELGNRSQIGLTRTQRAQMREGLLLHFEQQTGKGFFIEYRIGTQSIGGYVVDILYKDYIGVDIVQIRQQRAVTCRTEQQLARIGTERCIVRIDGYRIGRRTLL